MAKTLRQLAQRLNEIIAENDRRGWPERNDLPAGIEITRQTPTGRIRRSQYFTVQYVSSAQHTICINDNKDDRINLCGVVTATEKDRF